MILKEIEIEKLSEILTKIEGIQKTVSQIEGSKCGTKKWLTVKEAAEFLSVTPRTMWNYMDRGKIPFSNFGGKILFLFDHLQEFLEKHMVNVRGYQTLNEKA